jgi:putative FmdB family regulatory protein
MPNYDLKCQKCGHFFERFVRLNTPLGDCPGCKSDKLEKVPAAPGTAFKGTGWTRKFYQ